MSEKPMPCYVPAKEICAGDLFVFDRGVVRVIDVKPNERKTETDRVLFRVQQLDESNVFRPYGGELNFQRDKLVLLIRTE